MNIRTCCVKWHECTVIQILFIKFIQVYLRLHPKLLVLLQYLAMLSTVPVSIISAGIGALSLSLSFSHKKKKKCLLQQQDNKPLQCQQQKTPRMPSMSSLYSCTRGFFFFRPLNIQLSGETNKALFFFCVFKAFRVLNLKLDWIYTTGSKLAE